MLVLHAPSEVTAFADARRAAGEMIALIPTMGALHRGHAKLITEARAHGAQRIVSVFVNPTQFCPNEDYGKYPRTLDADIALAETHGATAIFAPTAASMYPEGDETRVRVGRTVEALCGEHRPGHFEGVTTVVAKLFNVVGPCTAIFGRKDFQQLAAIRRMVRDLFMPIALIGIPTIREDDGLALSSRNRYLTPEDRRRAVTIPASLDLAHRAFAGGERDADLLAALAREHLTPNVTSIDYVTVADPDTIVPIQGIIGERALLALAVRISGTRLIDNIVLGEDPSPLGERQ
jgi:pantoate--beta-alanine ligase